MKDADLRLAKLLLLVNAAVPATLLAWDAAHNRLDANPVNFAILTPGLNWLISFRRMLGLYAFFYALLHFLIFFFQGRQGSVSGTLTEMVRRKYLMVGATGLFVMVPLTVTSTNARIKRLGGKR